MTTPKVELAAAYISLVPSLKGAQREIEKEVAGVGDKAGKTGGNALAAGLRKSMKVAVGGGAIFAGIAAKKGLDRLLGIENARASLSGLGHDAKSVDAIMGNALDAVRGTAFGMAEAGKTAASAVAAGVKPGKELTRTLKLVGDAATIANTDMGSMGAIFNKVAAANKVQMDSINQLHDAGVPALQLIAKELGVTAEEASEMASKGKVDFATFQNAMEAGMGGAALKSGETTTGAWKNMWAAIGRIGANLMSGLFPKLAKGFSGITEWLGPLEDKTQVWGERLGDLANKYGTPAVGFLRRFTKGAKGLFDLLVKGDFTSTLREAFGWYEDSKAVGVLLDVRDAVGGIGKSLKDGAETGLKALRGVFEWMADHKTEVAVFFGVIGSAVVTVKAIGLATAAWAAAQKLLNIALSANPLGLVVVALAALAAGLVYAYKNSETFRKGVQLAWKHIQVAATLAWAVIQPVLKAWWFYISNVLWPVIKGLYEKVVKPAFQGIWSAIKWAWDKAGPVLDKFSTALSLVRDGFKIVKDYISRNWGSIADAITAPIEKAKKILNTFFAGIDKVVKIFTFGKKSFDFRFQVGNPGGASNATMNRPRGGIGAHHLAAARGAIGGKGGTGSKVWPANTKALSGNYPGHSGIDIAAAAGSPIKAAQSGVIDYVGWGRGYGNAIFQSLGGGLSAVYGHSSRSLVKAGQMVRAGQKIGLAGSTGNSTGPHLHFEVNAAGPFGSVGNRAATLAWLGGASFSKGGGLSIPKIPGLSLPGWIGGLGGLIRGWAGSWLKGQVFDTGGILNHGGVAVNLSGRPERVLTPRQTESFDRAVNLGFGRTDPARAYFTDEQIERLARAMETGADRRIDRREYETSIPRPKGGVE